MSTHHMITRSKMGRNQSNAYTYTENETDSSDTEEYIEQLPMENMRESVPNYYDSDQICCARDMSMSEYYEDALNNHPDKIDIYLQELYNIGCSLWNYNIIQIDHNNNFSLNMKFFDYYNWSFAEENVLTNCNFLRQMGHELFLRS